MLDFEVAPMFDCPLDGDCCWLGPDLAQDAEGSFDVQEGRALSQLTDLTRGEAASVRPANFHLIGCLLYSKKELILLTD